MYSYHSYLYKLFLQYLSSYNYISLSSCLTSLITRYSLSQMSRDIYILGQAINSKSLLFQKKKKFPNCHDQAIAWQWAFKVLTF